MNNLPDPPRQPEAEEALIRAALTPEINHRLRSARIVAGRAVIVAEAGDLSDPLGRLAAAGADHGSDTNGFCGIAHELNVLRLKC